MIIDAMRRTAYSGRCAAKSTLSVARSAILISLTTLTLGLPAMTTATDPAWNDIEIIRENVERPRAHYIAYPDLQEARSGSRTHAYRMQLDGDWSFNYSPSPAQRPASFFETDYDVSDWPTIPVPSNWERHGHGYAIYVNVPYPFEIDEPRVPVEQNPVGSYRRSFEVPEQWQSRELYVEFGAVSSAFYLWINGRYVGYSEGSKTPSEFNVTDYVHTGTNTIAVEVYRWSTGSYLEDQDMWSLSGIQRSVSLYARTKQHVRDYTVVAGLTNGYLDGSFQLDLDLTNTTAGQASVTTKVRLARHGQEVFAQDNTLRLPPGDSQQAFTAAIPTVDAWSAEIPNLYELTITLSDKDQRVLEVIRQHVGFRNAQIINGRFLINGKLVKLKGTNLHEHHHDSGHVIDEQTLLQDIRMMKAANLNAVRTSHYPFPEHFYELTDKHGLYVVDEANIESHGYGYDHDKTLGNKPHWMAHHLDRTQRMVERDKNFSSIVIWSLGNEAGDGVNLGTTYKWIKENDVTRPVQYETEGDLALVGERHSDFHSSMYWRHWDLEEYAQTHNDRPFVLIEYAHSMGNSTGNLNEYWDVIHQHDILAGGFIWDWVDQGLLEHADDGTPFWTYGGDYGPADVPSSGNFNFNGVVFPDRSAQPAYWEVQRVYQHVAMTPINLTTGEIQVHNQYNFLPLNGFDLHWVRQHDGEVLDNGVITDLAIAPGDKRALQIRYQKKTPAQGELFLNLQLVSPEPRDLLPKNHTYARAQLKIPGSARKMLAQPRGAGRVSLLDTDGKLVISTSHGHVEINQTTGLLSSLVFDDRQYLQAPLRPDLWRAPTDNDFGNYMGDWAGVWQQASGAEALRSLEVLEETAKVVRLRAVFSYRSEVSENVASWTTDYTFWPGGDVDISNTFERADGLPELPRVGMNVELIPAIDQVTWYGRGPMENYSDRKNAADVGLYQNRVGDHYVAYMRPQENGYKTDTRWLSLTDGSGTGLRITAHDLISFAVHHNRRADFTPPFKVSITDEDGPDAADNQTRRNTHVSDIKPQPLISLNVDFGQMGVGGDDSWGKRTLQPYMLNQLKYQYGFRISPIQGD